MKTKKAKAAQPAPAQNLQQGDTVWVANCYEKRDRTIVAKVGERVFERVHADYCHTGEDRFVLVMPGRPYGKGYGTAYKPEDVYRHRDTAVFVLREKISERINAWRSALDAAW